MQPQLQALMENKRLLAIVAVVAVVIIGIIAFVAMNSGGGGKHSEADKPLTEGQKMLATVTSVGQALEIQAMLAKKGIRLKEGEGEGGKIPLYFQDDATQGDRDIAIVTLVESGLMDRNVGLEIFEKGDLTASREEKRIKLVRAQQGELARLIRRIDPIKDASVNIAIPEPSLFRSEKKPLSASVQVDLEPGTRLTRDKVRAIINLVVGSLPDIDAAHVSLSDTNGNTYNSVLDSGAEVQDKLAEKDEYMRQKVAAQLDRLVGPGHYVVTVSTELREAPREVMEVRYDPSGAVVGTKQAFTENLNTNGGGIGAGGPASSFLPNSLNAAPFGGGPSKDYLRNGTEVAYNNSKTQAIETHPVGKVEDISIAVTIDSNHFPNMPVEDLQVLIANAANPMVRPENVTVAKSGMTSLDHFASAGAPEEEGIPWWWWAAGSAAVLIFLWMVSAMMGRRNTGNDEELVQTIRELQELRQIASQQQAALQATQQQTQLLLEAQQRQQLQPAQQPVPQMAPAAPEPSLTAPPSHEIQQTLEELRAVVGDEELLEDDSLDLQIKSWIESS